MKIFSTILSIFSKVNTIINLPKYWATAKTYYAKLVTWVGKYPKIFTPTFLALIVIFILVLFTTGCSTTVKEKIVTVTETVEVKTPIPCEVKDLTCSFEGEQYVPTKKLLECLIIHKRIIEICSGKNSAIPLGTSQEKIQEYLSEEVEKFNAKFNSKK